MEEFGAGSGTEGVQAFPWLLLKLIRKHVNWDYGVADPETACGQFAGEHHVVGVWART